MAINIKLKTSKDSDAQRQGWVGYDSSKIYGSEGPYAEDKNGDRVKSIFSSSYAELEPQIIADRLNNRLPTSGDDFNPDFPLGSVSYTYNAEEVSNNVRSDDLHNVENCEQRKAPNVSLPGSEEYTVPFKSETSKGGFGNDAEEGSLHSGGLEGAEGLLDSIEILTKYS